VVWSLVVPYVVLSLESFQKFHQNLLFSPFATQDIRMLLCVVDTCDVVNVNEAITIFVQLLESLADNTLPEFVHGTSDNSQEFVIFNQAIAVQVKFTEKDLNFALTESKHVIRHTLRELILIQLHRVVFVVEAELLREAYDAASTTRCQLCTQSL
jgi:hypothetical protein